MVQEKSLGHYAIPDYEGYFITKCGKVYSSYTARYLSPNIHYRSGYLSVQLRITEGVFKRVNIHSLMCRTFIDAQYLDKKLVCNHINGIKSDNRLENIEVTTQAENGRHAYKMGLNKPSPQIGEKHGMCLLTEDKVIQIYLLHKQGGITQKELAEKYGVKRVTISDITRGKNWKHITKNLQNVI